MPIYEYICQACQQEQEHLIRSDQTPHCEACGSENLQKLLSMPFAHSHAREAGQAMASGPGKTPSGPCGSGCGCFPG